MNVHRGVLRASILIGVAWVTGSAAVWYTASAGDRAQIAVLDECNKIYAALPGASQSSKPFDPNYCAGKLFACNVFDQFDVAGHSPEDALPGMSYQLAPPATPAPPAPVVDQWDKAPPVFTGKLEIEQLPPLTAPPPNGQSEADEATNQAGRQQETTANYNAVDSSGHLGFPAGYHLGSPYESSEAGDAVLHPDCAPMVGDIPLADFVVMRMSDRQSVRHRFEDALHATTISAAAYGARAPASLLALGLVLGWAARGLRSA